MSITLASLANWEVAVNSFAIVATLYLVRYLSLRLFAKDFLFPELFIAPRGLITVLLFFVLKESSIKIEAFDMGLLLYPILITSIIMMISLISYKGDKVKDVLFHKMPLIKTENKEEMEKRMEENTERHDFDGF